MSSFDMWLTYIFATVRLTILKHIKIITSDRLSQVSYSGFFFFLIFGYTKSVHTAVLIVMYGLRMSKNANLC